MFTSISQGVKVSIEARYQETFSRPAEEDFMFVYTVRIENLTEEAVQLLRRQWYIFDSNGEHREVEGIGVIGQTPIIEPKEIYEYESACKLKSEIGNMHGFYTMMRLNDRKIFKAEIPEFELIPSYKLN